MADPDHEFTPEQLAEIAAMVDGIDLAEAHGFDGEEFARSLVVAEPDPDWDGLFEAEEPE
jgi:hypothetical protein